MSNFQAGPWIKNNYGELIAANGKQVGVWNLGIAHIYRSDEAEANVRLIAAAPDLLEALRMVVGMLQHKAVTPLEMRVIDMAKEAIAKALTPQS